jgi:hypothetical protein
MSNIQCAECNKNPACNADPYFESQLFCWEKISSQRISTKSKRVCNVGSCFIGIDNKEMSE